MAKGISASAFHFASSAGAAQDICALADVTYAALKPLNNDYNGFDAWFYRTTLPQLISGHRKLFVYMACGNVVAAVIAKRHEERKLCTVWVDDRCRGFGLGPMLAAEALKWLGTSKPAFTVPERRLTYFRSFLAEYDFVLTDAITSSYRAYGKEYLFNLSNSQVAFYGCGKAK